MSHLDTSEESRRRMAARSARWRRWIALAIAVCMATAVVVVVADATPASQTHRRATVAAAPSRVLPPPPRTVPATTVRPSEIIPPHPGVARVYMHGSPRREVALTFDDGTCPSCAARIIHTLARTGAHATIFPNGRYEVTWDPLAPAIRHLVASGQLTIGNHTFLHMDPLEESPDEFGNDLERNETWIERTFGVSARPFFRPPYGAYNSATLSVAGSLGYTKVIMWSGTVADSSPHTIGYIVQAIGYWAKPGAIILMHANLPATSLALPQILNKLRQRGLHTVTLDQLLGG